MASELCDFAVEDGIWVDGCGTPGCELCRKTALSLPPQPPRWRAGPCLAAQCSSCPAARPLCLSGSLFLSPSLWMASLVSVVLKVSLLALLPVFSSMRWVAGTLVGFLLWVLTLGIGGGGEKRRWTSFLGTWYDSMRKRMRILFH